MATLIENLRPDNQIQTNKKAGFLSQNRLFSSTYRAGPVEGVRNWTTRIVPVNINN
jgi:hypothetical protein